MYIYGCIISANKGEIDMAKARFSLGYEYNNKLTSLSIFDRGDHLIGSELTDVINFTTSFNNEEQLREYLKNGPSKNNIPEDAKLVYLREPDNLKYEPTKVLDIDHICYATSNGLLEPDAQLKYLIDNRYDIDFIEKLYISIMYCLINVKNIKRFYTTDDYDNDSRSRLISVFKNNKKNIPNGNNFLFLFMDEIYSETYEANKRGIENYEYELDKKDLKYLIKRLYDNITVIKDKKGNFKHNQNNGKIERYSRILGYFAILISKDMNDKFDEYLKSYEEQYDEIDENKLYELLMEEEKKKHEEYEKNDLYNYRDEYDPDEHDEEFLTTEDFESKGMDPESNGYKIR